MGILTIVLQEGAVGSAPAPTTGPTGVFQCNLGRTIPTRGCKIVAWSISRSANPVTGKATDTSLKAIKAEIPFLTSNSNTLIANGTELDESGQLLFPIDPYAPYETHKEDMSFGHMTQIPSLFTAKLYKQDGTPFLDANCYMTIQIEFHQSRLL